MLPPISEKLLENITNCALKVTQHLYPRKESCLNRQWPCVNNRQLLGPRSNEQAAQGAAAVLFPLLCEDVWGTWEILAKLPPGSVKPDP